MIYNYETFKIFEELKNDIDTSRRSGRLLADKRVYLNEIETVKEPIIVFTDVVKSSELWSRDSVKMIADLKNHFNLVTKIADKYNGWIIKTIGDAFMLYFEPVEESVYNAIKFAQELIKTEPVYSLRIGMAKGVVSEGTYIIQKKRLKDYHGNTVNTASRMESIISDVGGMGISLPENMDEKLINKLKSDGIKVVKIGDQETSINNLRGATAKNVYKIFF